MKNLSFNWDLNSLLPPPPHRPHTHTHTHTNVYKVQTRRNEHTSERAHTQRQVSRGSGGWLAAPFAVSLGEKPRPAVTLEQGAADDDEGHTGCSSSSPAWNGDTFAEKNAGVTAGPGRRLRGVGRRTEKNTVPGGLLQGGGMFRPQPPLLLPILSSSPSFSSSSCFFLPAPPGGRQGAPTSPALISRVTSGKQLWLQMGEPQQFSVRRRLSSAQRSSRCSSPFSTGSSPQLRVPIQPQQQIETFTSTSTATADMGVIVCSIEIASSLVGNLQLRGLDLHSYHILYQLPLITTFKSTPSVHSGG